MLCFAMDLILPGDVCSLGQLSWGEARLFRRTLIVRATIESIARPCGPFDFPSTLDRLRSKGKRRDSTRTILLLNWYPPTHEHVSCSPSSASKLPALMRQR